MKRLTPMEIFNKDFKHVMRGYDIDEVNEFLDLVIKSYEDVLQENEYLKEQLRAAKKQNTGRNNRVQEQTGQYDEIIREILARIDRLEKMMRR
ncbi:DivIVA domain-containing protein [Paenactinomyces guangxiensis]|uniref:DivIVA domain-containing protein n=1 Tax=Paenactinomyces guangxiensis TaxID=1490290 RepID=A0A7W1WNL9_9BACL|nr:DivIVA domain-containing protein [Paenactinomyces guangxiensis]MBA4493209.1 DivIVA domain-containing protein [Paenactinomyces guangxiensis]MBH8589941.1 DivIVA domain-containing protein [Paenactinomyces guangxiensis]